MGVSTSRMLFGFTYCEINPRFFPWDNSLQKMLSLIGVMYQLQETESRTTNYIIVFEVLWQTA
jgi:hypothetical protein